MGGSENENRDAETYFQIAKNSYERSIERFSEVRTRAYEIARIIGVIGAIGTGVFVFVLKVKNIPLTSSPTSGPFLLACGAILMLLSMISSLVLIYFRLPRSWHLIPRDIKKEYEESKINRQSAASWMLEVAAYNRKTVRSWNLRLRITLFLAVFGLSVFLLGFSLTIF